MSDAGWKKSSRSAQGSNCVETARRGGFPAIRDSKDPAGAHLRLSDTAFGRFIHDVKHDAFAR
ncbi:DUF397 domain-containing protein [Saccharopolyspora sp. NPDC047091]|uniref:DUF397 domain-containing protein n=1 Tax=Saccharopolyspora sp. NPDC047091 TaxID=3155924 RepID=UPI0033CFF576